MKIFFLAPKITKSYPWYKSLVTLLKNEGHQVFSDWMDSSSEQDASNIEGTYKKNLTWIKTCDIVVAEITEASRGVTFLLALALEYKKPILALFAKHNSSGRPSSTILATSKVNRLMTYKECNNENYQKVIKEYLLQVKRVIDTKFILIISPEIDRYLEWASENRRMHKAQVVRTALEDVIEKDREYKAYEKQQSKQLQVRDFYE